MAGTDTGSHVMALAVYQLAKNPRIFEKLYQEIDPDHFNKDKIEEIQDKPYLNAVIKETLRYYPPGNALFPRIAT